jgi:hypothetical protein
MFTGYSGAGITSYGLLVAAAVLWEGIQNTHLWRCKALHHGENMVVVSLDILFIFIYFFITDLGGPQLHTIRIYDGGRSSSF